MIRLTAMTALLSVAASTSAYAQCTQADKTALEAMDKAWGEAGLKGDAAFLDKVYAAQFMTHNPAGTVDKATTIANSRINAERNRANPQPQVTADYYVISCTPLTATITHRNVGAPATGSSAAAVYTRSIHFLEKRGNTWQVVSSTAHGLTDAQQLTYLEHEWNAATRDRNSAWVETNFASFASEVASRTGAMDNKAQSVESMKNSRLVYDILELSDMNTRVEGEVALVTGINHAKGKDGDGKAFERRIRFTDTFIKRDGRWLVWASQGTLIQ